MCTIGQQFCDDIENWSFLRADAIELQKFFMLKLPIEQCKGIVELIVCVTYKCTYCTYFKMLIACSMKWRPSLFMDFSLVTLMATSIPLHVPATMYCRSTLQKANISNLFLTCPVPCMCSGKGLLSTVLLTHPTSSICKLIAKSKLWLWSFQSLIYWMNFWDIMQVIPWEHLNHTHNKACQLKWTFL